MKDKRYHANYVVPNELLDHDPTATQEIIKHLGEQLTEKLFREIQKGEKIVSFKDLTTNNVSLNITELRQEISIMDLVRCKDCKYNYANLIPSDNVCSLCVELPITKDFFCAYGEKIDEKEIYRPLQDRDISCC